MRRIDRHDREQFTAALLKAVPTATRAHATKLLFWGATYGRLAEAACNGDWPYSDGTGNSWFCTDCEVGLRCEPPGRCPSCRAERIIRKTCESMGRTDAHGTPYFGGTDQPSPDARPWVVADFEGDPRGHTVRLQIAGASLDAYERAALAVPTS